MKQPDVFTLVAAAGPYAEYAEQLMLYGQFVGAWDIDAVWVDRQGGRRNGRGE